MSARWKIVPVEMTEAMQSAAESHDVSVRHFFECPHATIRSECYSGNPACGDGEDNNHNCADAVFRQVLDDGNGVGAYRAMLAAAPRASEDAELIGELTDALWDIFDECDIESIPETQRRKLARAILAYLEGAQ